MPASFELKGADKMRGEIEELARKALDGTKRALRLEAERIRTESLRKYVPKDLGTLAGSIKVHPVQYDGSEISVRITAGDASAPYALAIHEHPSDASPPSWQGKPIEDILSVRERTPWSLAEGQRGPKYIERPLMAAVPGMAGRIAKAVEL